MATSITERFLAIVLPLDKFFDENFITLVILKFQAVTLAIDGNKKLLIGLILLNKNFSGTIFLATPDIKIIQNPIFESFMTISTSHSKIKFSKKIIEIFKMRNFMEILFFAGLGLVLGDKILHMPLDERQG